MLRLIIDSTALIVNVTHFLASALGSIVNFNVLFLIYMWLTIRLSYKESAQHLAL